MQIISEKDPQAIKIAADFLRAGKVISFAADTVYGVAVDASNPNAVADLYQLKGRDEKKPVAIFVGSSEVAEKIFVFSDLARRIAFKLLPGALTLVLKQQENCAIKIAKNLNSDAHGFLGFRIIDRPFVVKLLQEFDGVLAVTSANRSGEVAANNSTEVENYFADSHLALLVNSEEPLCKIASTVVKVDGDKLEILRHGAVDESVIKNC